MLKIVFSETINASHTVVWRVITNADDYPAWNRFVISCQSTFEVGAPIIMRVKLLPFLTLRQKETVLRHTPHTLLEYGIRIPGLLVSSRQHRLTAITADTTEYESVFLLQGMLSPLVNLILGAPLKRGFLEMTRGVAQQAHAIGHGD
ncbi:MAG TPA: SRPBCC domain-containing protein [Pseudomonadales bacterium]|jgi:hypothetical protein